MTVTRRVFLMALLVAALAGTTTSPRRNSNPSGSRPTRTAPPLAARKSRRSSSTRTSPCGFGRRGAGARADSPRHARRGVLHRSSRARSCRTPTRRAYGTNRRALKASSLQGRERREAADVAAQQLEHAVLRLVLGLLRVRVELGLRSGLRSRRPCHLARDADFSVPKNVLLWAGMSETENPKNGAAVVAEVVKEAAKEMKKQGLARELVLP